MMDLEEKKKIYQIKIPQSDEIFYFDHNVYDEKALKPFITKEYLDYIITECEKVVCLGHIKKSKFENQKIKKWIYILPLISIIIFIIFLIILYYSPRYNKGKKLYLTSICFGFFGYLILLSIIFYNFCKRKVIGKNIEDFVDDELTKYFNQIKTNLNEINFRYDKKKKMIILSCPEKKEKKHKNKNKLSQRNELFLGKNIIVQRKENGNLIVNSFDEDYLTSDINFINKRKIKDN